MFLLLLVVCDFVGRRRKESGESGPGEGLKYVEYLSLELS